MSYKTVLVPVGPDAGSQSRLQFALRFADMFGGSLIGLAAETVDPMIADMGFIDAGIYQQLVDDIQARLREAEALFRKTVPASGGHAWKAVFDEPVQAACLFSRGADLIVTSRPDQASALARPGGLVMGSGTPVLIAPAHRTDMSLKHVVVGWKDTRECRRAVRDALPLLRRAATVFLTQIAEPALNESMQQGLREVVQRLQRHGVVAEIECSARSKRSVAGELEHAAERHGADLIVTGAYGHSRFREWALGGVTQELADSASRFVFLSH